MTEYELLDLSAAYTDTALSALMGYITVLSAYFIVAYIAGHALNRSQVIAVSGLFLVTAIFMIWGSTSYFYLAYGYRISAEGLDVPVAGWKLLLPLLLIGVVLGLKFMWDVRHPKTE